MTTDSSREFLLRMRAEGRTDDEIRGALRTSGWAEADIDALFASLLAAPPPPSESLDASTSGTGAPAPDWVRDMGWSWGACGLTWIWGIANRVWVTFLAFLSIIPLVGWAVALGLAVWLGMSGHSLAWQHRRFSSADQFRSTMRSWNIAGLVAFIVFIAASAVVPPALLIPQFVHSREKARLASCESNVKQLDLGLLMYCQDYDEQYPPAAKARACLYPYLKNNQAWQCPSGGTYAMNPKLSELSMEKLPRPAETVSFYEVDASGKPIFPHLGEGVFGFADGHVRAYKRADAPSLALPAPPAPGK